MERLHAEREMYNMSFRADIKLSAKYLRVCILIESDDKTRENDQIPKQLNFTIGCKISHTAKFILYFTTTPINWYSTHLCMDDF